MPFTLQITISGLCLFVPQKKWVFGDLLHVLLIEHGAAPHDRHCPRLVYDTAYEDGLQQPTGQLVCKPLENCVLNLNELGNSLDLFLPTQLVDLSNVMK